MTATQSTSYVVANQYPQAGVAFIADNTGRNITQGYATSILSTGTYAFNPVYNKEYRKFTVPLTGNLTINVGTASDKPYINETADFLFTGGSLPYNIVLGTQMTAATSRTIVAASGSHVALHCTFDGTTYICSSTIGIA